MSFIDQMMNKHSALNQEGWKVLNDAEQLTDIIDTSFTKPVVIFKHSTRCGISAMIKHGLESDWSFGTDELELYYLDLIAYRAISNQVAEDYKVLHQSPQALVIVKGKVVWHGSHQMVTVDALRNALPVG